MSFEDKSIVCSDCAATLRLPLGNKSSIRVKASPMSLSVVPHAAGPIKHSVPTVAVTATVHDIKSFAPLYQWGA